MQDLQQVKLFHFQSRRIYEDELTRFSICLVECNLGNARKEFRDFIMHVSPQQTWPKGAFPWTSI